MLSSAIASSSPVVMPGRTEVRSRSSVRPTTRPARRMSAICSGDLIWIPRSRRPNATSPSALGYDVQGVEDALGDVLDVTHAVHLEQRPPLAVDADQRLRLLGVELLAAADDVLGV